MFCALAIYGAILGLLMVRYPLKPIAMPQLMIRKITITQRTIGSVVSGVAKCTVSPLYIARKEFL